MANRNDESTLTETGVADGDTTDTVAVKSSDNGLDVSIFVDDGSDGAPADFTLIAERYSELEERWMRFGSESVTGASNPQSFTDPAVPDEMRYSVTNDSGGSADYRVNVVSY